MERDEVYVPKTRSELGIPREADGHTVDYEDYFGDTPIYTLFMLIRQQVLAFPAYLSMVSFFLDVRLLIDRERRVVWNVSGQKSYPSWTNHFNRKSADMNFDTRYNAHSPYTANSILFTKAQRQAVMLSNLGIFSMCWAVRQASLKWGAGEVVKYYGIPWLCVTHWFIMITYLHHTAPELPHYRSKEWSFSRGAAATVDRDFLGWMGRFFLHDVAHYHVVHHFFPKMPFCRSPYFTFSQRRRVELTLVD